MSNNTYIRSLYAPEFSSLTLSFFRTNLTLKFAPYVGKDNVGLSKYDTQKFLSTTVNYEGAAALYLTANPILNGNENQRQLMLPCSNNATLIFEYLSEQYNQMSAYLVIDKNGETIPFRFGIHQYKVKENGQMVPKVIQTELGVFAKTLDAYLTGIGADLHLNKLSEEELDDQLTPLLIG